MPKNKNKKSYTLYAFHIPVLVLAGLALVGGFFMYQQSRDVLDPGTDILGKKSSKSNNSSKSDKSGKNEDKGKPDKAEKTNPSSVKSNKGQNAVEYKTNKKKAAEELQTVAILEEDAGNEEVSEEIEEVAQEEIEDAVEVSEAIDQIETRNKWKTLLFGSDYKNLGQLRSNLVQNRNNIRKITKNMNGTAVQGSEDALQEQLQVMVQERERIKQVIVENESEFSLLGWVTRFLTGYDYAPIDDAEEEALEDEVEAVLDGTGDTQESTQSETETGL